MTLQEWYDKVVTRRIEGKLPAIDQDETCCYRAEGDKRCLVGILIPEEKYEPGWEGETLYDLPDSLTQEILPAGVSREEMYFLQSLHDRLGSRWTKPEDFWEPFHEILCGYLSVHHPEVAAKPSYQVAGLIQKQKEKRHAGTSASPG